MIMKKFFILVAVLSFIPATPFNVYVYNNTTNYDLYYMLGTRPKNSGAFYPHLISRGNFPEAYGGTNLYFVKLGFLESTIYSNSGYPYNATVSPASAQVTHWVRALTATSSPINTSNSLAQSLFGATQRYSDFKFYLKNSLGDVIGSGNLDRSYTNWKDSSQIPLDNGIQTTYIPLLDENDEVTDIFILFD